MPATHHPQTLIAPFLVTANHNQTVIRTAPSGGELQHNQTLVRSSGRFSRRSSR